MDFKNICMNYAKLMAQSSIEETIDGDRVFRSNELVFTFEMVDNKWTPVGLGFELFGAEAVLLTSGEIYLSPLSPEDAAEGYAMIVDDETLTKYKEFLVWRLRVLKDLKF